MRDRLLSLPRAAFMRVQDAPDWALVLVPTLVAAAVSLLLWDPRMSVGGDTALYWALARSLAELGEYRDLTAPGDPLETSVPWGWPALLSVGVRLGADYVSMKWLAWACLVAGFAALGAWLLRLFPERKPVVLLALLCCAINHHVLIYSSMLLSEAPYLLLSSLALLGWERGRRSLAWLGLAAALAAFCYLVRPIAVSLVGGVLGTLFLTRRWKGLGLALVVVAVVAGSWHLRSTLVPTEEQNLYVDMLTSQSKYGGGSLGLGGYLARVVDNALAYAGQPLTTLALARSPSDPPLGLAVGLVVMAGLGLWSIRERCGPLPIYLGLYLLALVSWPSEAVRVRYLAMIWPPLLALAFAGLWWGLSRFPRLAPVALLALTAGLSRPHFRNVEEERVELKKVRRKVRKGALQPLRKGRYLSLVDMYVALDEQDIEPDAVLGCRKPRMAWLHTGHKAVHVRYSDSPDDMMRWLDEDGVDLLLTDSFKEPEGHREQVDATLEAFPGRFELLHVTGKGDRMYRVLPAAP